MPGDTPATAKLFPQSIDVLRTTARLYPDSPAAKVIPFVNGLFKDNVSAEQRAQTHDAMIKPLESSGIQGLPSLGSRYNRDSYNFEMARALWTYVEHHYSNVDASNRWPAFLKDLNTATRGMPYTYRLKQYLMHHLPLPPAQNLSTSRNIAAMRDFLEHYYPTTLTRPENWNDAKQGAWNLTAAAQQEQHNKALHEAFEQYAATVVKPNRLYEWVAQKLKRGEGLTREQWTVIVEGLAMRVAPTNAELESFDGYLRSIGYNLDAIVANIGDEAGDGKRRKSHVQLFHESVAVLQRTLSGRHDGAGIDMPHSITIHEMVKQLIRLRKEGVEIRSEEDDGYVDPPRLEPYYRRQYERFKQECALRKFPSLPNDIDAAFQHHDARNDSGDVISIHATGALHDDVNSFASAVRIAELLPDGILDYEAGMQGTREGMATNAQPQQQDLLRNLLGFTTREANADKRSHIEAYKLLADAHVGYVDDIKIPLLSEETTASLKKKLTLWPDIHVGTHGVEEDHADGARLLWLVQMQLQRGDAAKPYSYDTTALTDAFRHVVQEGYLSLQHKHMDLIVDKLQALERDPPSVDAIPQKPELEQIMGRSKFASAASGFVDRMRGMAMREGHVASH